MSDRQVSISTDYRLTDSDLGRLEAAASVRSTPMQTPEDKSPSAGPEAKRRRRGRSSAGSGDGLDLAASQPQVGRGTADEEETEEASERAGETAAHRLDRLA